MGKNSFSVPRQKNESVPVNPFETSFFRVTWLLFGDEVLAPGGLTGDGFYSNCGNFLAFLGNGAVAKKCDRVSHYVCSRCQDI